MANSLPKMPSLPKLTKSVRCECGCGTLCTNRFAPGHDAKLLGMVKRVNARVWDKREDATTTDQLDALAVTMGSEGMAEATARALGIAWVAPSKRKAVKAS